MADFLDQKEEVLKIELTKHGRKLLGLGIFNPEYYSFFDDSIIYDTNYISTQEEQNTSQDRILDNSLTFGALNLLNENTTQEPLGTSLTDNDYAPSWTLNVLNGAISFIEESSSYYKNVFTASSITYGLELKKTNVSNITNYNLSTYELEDGKIIDISDDYVLLELKENNMEDNYENFEIEFFSYDPLTTGISGSVETKLNFIPRKNNIIDGIIYEDSELPSKFSDIDVTKNDVSYFFDILVDDEIDQAIITKAAKKLIEEVKATYTTTFEGPAKEDC
jgi:hypothetical protein